MKGDAFAKGHILPAAARYLRHANEYFHQFGILIVHSYLHGCMIQLYLHLSIEKERGKIYFFCLCSEGVRNEQLYQQLFGGGRLAEMIRTFCDSFRILPRIKGRRPGL
jgi:hypothetical protein